MIGARNVYVPKHAKRKRNEIEPIWFNKTCSTLVSKQRKLYNRYKKSKCTDHLAIYKHCRRENKKVFRARHNEYMYSRLYEPLCKGDSKAFYSFLKSKSGSNKQLKSLQSSTLTKLLDDPVDIASELNNYFKSVFNPKGDGYVVRSENLSHIKIEIEGVKCLIKNLKSGKAVGPDLIGKKDLNLSPDVNSLILAKIYQYSIDTSTLPSIWKFANVAPIYKGGVKSCAGNYRPVSLTSIPCKMLEHIVLHNMSSGLNEILVPSQHGFRKGLSCTTQLLTTTQSIMQEVDLGGCVKAAVLDFSKAFDKVPHFLLLQKLEMYGFSRNILLWIMDFLSNRKQRVLLQGHVSDYQAVTSGVPQGSVLGPALFLVYINDISEGLSSNIRLFADDALLHLTLRDKESVTVFQEDLDLLENWAKAWGMSFNTNKCSLITFGNSNGREPADSRYYLGGTELVNVDSFKYLGVLINKNFDWGDHIGARCNDTLRTIGLLRRTISSAPERVKLQAYKTLCRPKLDYAAEVWDPFLVKHVESLELVQNKAVRFVGNLRGRSGVTDKREALGLDLLSNRRKIQRLRMFHVIRGSSDESLQELNGFIDRCFNTHSHNTRSQTQGVPSAVFTNSRMCFNSFIIRTGRDMRIL